MFGLAGQGIGRYAVVGASLPRHEHAFQGLPLDEELQWRKATPRCGLQVIDLETGTIDHWLRMEGKVHELYDVIAPPDVLRLKAYGFQTDDIRFHVAFEEDGHGRSWKGASRK